MNHAISNVPKLLRHIGKLNSSTIFRREKDYRVQSGSTDRVVAVLNSFFDCPAMGKHLRQFQSLQVAAHR